MFLLCSKDVMFYSKNIHTRAENKCNSITFDESRGCPQVKQFLTQFTDLLWGHLQSQMRWVDAEKTWEWSSSLNDAHDMSDGSLPRRFSMLSLCIWFDQLKSCNSPERCFTHVQMSFKKKSGWESHFTKWLAKCRYLRASSFTNTLF